MSRDYKPARQPSRERPPASGGGAFRGVIYGLVLGLVIAAAVAWWFNRMPTPFVDKSVSGPAKTAANTPVAGAPAPAVGAPAAEPKTNVQSENGQPIVLGGKPGDLSAEKRFQFPDILSGKTDGTKTAAKSEDLPPKANAKAVATDMPVAPPETSNAIYLMAGSYQKQSDAETQKATLALQGFDAEIQKGVIGEKIWYRVKIGPFKRQDDANRVRNELKELGIESVPARNN